MKKMKIAPWDPKTKKLHFRQIAPLTPCIFFRVWFFVDFQIFVIEQETKPKKWKKRKIIVGTWGQPGSEAICTQAAALRYAIRVHLEHLDQFKRQKNAWGCQFRKKVNAKLPRVETHTQAENTDERELQPTVPKEGGWNKHTALVL